ncbi:MAG TPA: hypothetical protein VMU12_01650 [Candidatus Paceibacterota bacterium]|nr:hypothetical protein [Candidatus Paceibacterota bacterium]
MGSLPAGQAISLSDIVTLISDVVNYLLILSGIVVVGVVVYAGIMMATAGSSEDRFKKGKSMLINAMWGALVIFGVGVIVRTLASFAQAPTQIIR